MPKEPIRPVRMSNELWAKIQAKAAREGISASEAIRRLCIEWVSQK